MPVSARKISLFQLKKAAMRLRKNPAKYAERAERSRPEFKNIRKEYEDSPFYPPDFEDAFEREALRKSDRKRLREFPKWGYEPFTTRGAIQERKSLRRDKTRYGRQYSKSAKERSRSRRAQREYEENPYRD